MAVKVKAAVLSGKATAELKLFRWRIEFGVSGDLLSVSVEATTMEFNVFWRLIMKIDYKLIGERIRNARKAKGWSQDKLTEKMDISVAFLSRIERGTSEVNLKRLAEIARYLDVTMEYLISGTVIEDKQYLDRDLYEILIKCPPEKQRLIYDIARIVSGVDFV